MSLSLRIVEQKETIIVIDASEMIEDTQYHCSAYQTFIGYVIGASPREDPIP